MKTIKYLSFLFLTLGLVVGCEGNDNEFGDITAPTRLEVNTEIQGQDADNPYGDGNGFVTFTSVAANGITFQYDFGDGNSQVSGGPVTHRYTRVGVNDYTVIVSAVGTAGLLTSTTFDISVYSSFEDQEAVSFLSGPNEGDSKTWVWASDIPLHVGLGPVEDDYGNGEFAYEGWWNTIQPNDEEKSCMYVNEFVFSNTADGVTFEQTVGPAFVPGAYAGIIGVDGDTCHDETVATTMFGLKNVSFLPSTSKAALEGTYNDAPYRGTSFQISDGGFMGWYVGSVVYDIISVTANTLEVRFIQEGGGFAWYAKYKTAE